MKNLVLAALLGLIVAGCSRNSHTTMTASSPLRIAAASDLQNVLPVLLERYQTEAKIDATLTFGASGQLAEQIKAGAPFDLFLAANVKFVSELAAEGLVLPESVQPYAQGSLVLVVHRDSDSSQTIQGLADLKRHEIKKLAIANPAYAPYGIAARQTLERSGLWDVLQPKIVLAESVRQALVYAQQGDAEAALVGRAIASVPEVEIREIDESLHDPLVQALGIVTRSARPDAAGDFAGFILSERGQAVLHEYGFTSPRDTSPHPR